MPFTHPLHEKAIHLSKEFKRVEADLVDVFQKIDEQKIFRKMGFASLFDYANKGLGLSESVAYGLITVSRKSKEIPELKTAVAQGELSLSQAKRITSVLTKENALELIEKAKTMTQREIEKVVATINPKASVGERTRFISEDRIELKMSLKDELMKKLKRVQDLESQRTKRACDLEAVLDAMADFYLERQDPVVKSERILKKPSLRKEAEKDTKKKVDPSGDNATNSIRYNRLRLTSETKHRVNQRDQSQCTHIDNLGRRCSNKRWVEIHHVVPVSHGGDNRLENLTTLCHTHHRMTHEIKGSSSDASFDKIKIWGSLRNFEI
jgi:hypothetical protein